MCTVNRHWSRCKRSNTWCMPTNTYHGSSDQPSATSSYSPVRLSFLSTQTFKKTEISSMIVVVRALVVHVAAAMLLVAPMALIQPSASAAAIGCDHRGEGTGVCKVTSTADSTAAPEGGVRSCITAVNNGTYGDNPRIWFTLGDPPAGGAGARFEIRAQSPMPPISQACTVLDGFSGRDHKDDLRHGQPRVPLHRFQWPNAGGGGRAAAAAAAAAGSRGCVRQPAAVALEPDFRAGFRFVPCI